MNYTRAIICCPSSYDFVRGAYPNRWIEVSNWASEGGFYYFNPKGRVRFLKLSDCSIWETDHGAGFPFMKQVWPRNGRALREAP